MSNQHKNLIKKIFSSKIFLFLVTIILIVLAIGLIRETYHKYQLTKEINNLKSEMEQIEGNNQQLADLLGYLKQDSYLEKEARLKLNLKKPGEKVVILSESSNNESIENNKDQMIKNGVPEDVNKDVNKTEGANYWKWWEYFFNS